MKARENPFSTDRVLRLRYRLAGETWDALLARLARLGYRAALVGPKGAGKTTLLEELESKLSALGFVPKPLRLDTEHRCFPARFERGFFAAVERSDIVLLDGAEQMGLWRWWRFQRLSRQAGGLIVTSHRPGLLPTLLETRATPELLADLMAELLGRDQAATQAQARLLFARHGGNLRNALRELYDLAAASRDSPDEG